MCHCFGCEHAGIDWGVDPMERGGMARWQTWNCGGYQVGASFPAPVREPHHAVPFRNEFDESAKTAQRSLDSRSSSLRSAPPKIPQRQCRDGLLLRRMAPLHSSLRGFLGTRLKRTDWPRRIQSVSPPSQWRMDLNPTFADTFRIPLATAFSQLPGDSGRLSGPGESLPVEGAPDLQGHPSRDGW